MSVVIRSNQHTLPSGDRLPPLLVLEPRRLLRRNSCSTPHVDRVSLADEVHDGSKESPELNLHLVVERRAVDLLQDVGDVPAGNGVGLRKGAVNDGSDLVDTSGGGTP